MFDLALGFALFIIVAACLGMLARQRTNDSWLSSLRHGCDLLSGSWIQPYGRWLRGSIGRKISRLLLNGGETAVRCGYYVLRGLWLCVILLGFCYMIPIALERLYVALVTESTPHLAKHTQHTKESERLATTTTQTALNTHTVMGIPITTTFLGPRW